MSPGFRLLILDVSSFRAYLQNVYERIVRLQSSLLWLRGRNGALSMRRELLRIRTGEFWRSDSLECVFDRDVRPVKPTYMDKDMRKTHKICLLASLLVALGASSLPDHASAGPLNMLAATAMEVPASTEQIHYRRYYPRHYGYYRNYRNYGHYRHYGRYGYSGYNNPVGAAAGTAAGLATLPLRAVFGNPYYY